ncbi:MAG: sigma-54 dependent transcriptional regulator [Planctomycetota bacterium]|nr:sigma-54 dependent transcriptional regulator [Planctomycetota bacterium]
MLIRVLLVIEEPKLRQRLEGLFERPDVVVESPRGGKFLWERASRLSADVLIVQEDLIPAPVSESIAAQRALPESPWIVAMVREENAEVRARLLAAGCEAVLPASLGDAQLQAVFATVLAKRSELSVTRLREARPAARPSLNDFVSQSPAMQAFLGLVRKVAGSESTLLIAGETGVGKERLAQAVHHEGGRAQGPFVPVNCAALAESLLESELFGHEEGAFTGATRSRRGCFELAHRGTLFLDEIGEVPPHLQVKLLRALQEREIRRVGGEKGLPVDVRVMAATNRDLEGEVKAGRFRQDLYYRLSVVTLTIPPLRERREDIPTLAESYVRFLRARIGRDVRGIAPEVLEVLQNYTWPGNVRELINVIERAMLLCNGETITIADLPLSIGRPPAAVLHHGGNGNGQAHANVSEVPAEWLGKPLREVRQLIVEHYERAYLAGLLREERGRIGATAARAGIEPRSLYEKMRHYGLRKEDFKKKVS